MPTTSRQTASSLRRRSRAKSTKQTELLIGVDIGGTKILAGVFTPDLECIGRAKMRTKAHKGSAEVFQRITQTILEALESAKGDLASVRAIGCGAPGLIQPEKGVITFAPNLLWKNVPLKRVLERQLNLPVFVQNDANLATLGIYTAEFQSKPKQLVGIFVGTGIGAGIVLNGQVYTGARGSAGELGHMVLKLNGPKCGCGARGCFEAFASRTAIDRKLRKKIKKGAKSVLTEMLGPDLDGMRSRDLRRALEQRDELVRDVVLGAAENIGIAIANINNMLNPEVVALGGGVIEALGDEMLPVITKTARAHSIEGDERLQICASSLSDDAGIVGGAVLASRWSTALHSPQVTASLDRSEQSAKSQ